MSNSLQGRYALISGGGSGIGKAIALALGDSGAEVVVNYSNSPQKANEVVDAIKAAGGKSYAIQANIAEESEIEKLMKTILALMQLRKAK